MKLNAPLFLLGMCTFLLGWLYVSGFAFVEAEVEIHNAGEIYRSLGILALLLGFFFEQLMQRSKVWSAIALVLATLIAVLHLPPVLLWLSNAPVTDSPTIFPNAQTALYPVLHFFSLLCYVWLLRSSKPRQTLREQKVPLFLIALLPLSVMMTWLIALQLQTYQPKVYSLPGDVSVAISDDTYGQLVGIPGDGNEPMQVRQDLLQSQVPAHEKWCHPTMRGTHIYSKLDETGRTYFLSDDLNTSGESAAKIVTRNGRDTENLPYSIIWEPFSTAAIIHFLDSDTQSYSLFLVQPVGAFGTNLPITISVELLKLPFAPDTQYSPVAWVYQDTVLLRKSAPAFSPEDLSMDIQTYWLYSLAEKKLLKQVDL